jgi:hypothetical protein
MADKSKRSKHLENVCIFFVTSRYFDQQHDSKLYFIEIAKNVEFVQDDGRDLLA